MSPASKSNKSKEKSTPRGGKEQPKVSIKASPVHSNGGNGSSASAYNPALGTFHTLEMSSSCLTPPSNGRFRTIDDPEDHSGNSPGTTGEYDSFSNNGSCSGESEDQKEKFNGTTPRVESIPGCDGDKRDKIRQKNERKHQRQKEKRAQDLHERCNAFLTSRKLEALSHQLVTMGFPADRAMMAIIANEGRMEESVAWLLHEVDEDDKHVSIKLEDKFNLKVDITEELARIAVMEAKYGCTKQDVERAVVSFEGDLMKTEGSLRLQKRTVSATAVPKSEEPVDFAGINDNIAASNQNSVLTRSLIKGATSPAPLQQRRDERDLNYKTPVPGSSPQESANRNLQQALKKMQQPKSTDWSRLQVSPVDNRWMTMSSAPSVSYPPLTSPVQVSGPPVKSEPQFGTPTISHEVQTSFQSGALKEPFVVMRRPKQSPSSSSIDTSVSPPASTGWYPNGAPSMEILMGPNDGTRHNLSGMGTSGSTLRHIYPRNNLHQMPPSGVPELTASSGWSNQSWNVSGTSLSSSLTVPSSLGLFTGWGPSGSSGSSQNDWNSGGLTPHRDYTSIDWSLDLTPLRPSLKNDMASDTWSTMFMGGNASRPLMNGGGGVYLPGLQERGGLLTDPLASATSQEWTNPFEGRDLFRIPRQYVTSSPSL